MRKKVYAIYMHAYPDNTLEEETLQECLRDYMKEMKIGRSNPNGGLSACLQNNKVLEQLKRTNSHASMNILGEEATHAWRRTEEATRKKNQWCTISDIHGHNDIHTVDGNIHTHQEGQIFLVQIQRHWEADPNLCQKVSAW